MNRRKLIRHLVFERRGTISPESPPLNAILLQQLSCFEICTVHSVTLTCFSCLLRKLINTFFLYWRVLREKESGASIGYPRENQRALMWRVKRVVRKARGAEDSNSLALKELERGLSPSNP